MWRASLPATWTFAEARFIRVRACVNGRCLDGALSGSQTEPRAGSSSFISLEPAGDGVGGYGDLIRNADGTYGVGVVLSMTGARDGDRHLIEVFDRDGVVIAGVPEAPVTYDTYNVNIAGPLGECRTVFLSDSLGDAGR
jgi:hypothetical protein